MSINPNTSNSLIEQYREAHEMQRKLLELFWQEPTVIVAIAGAIVVASYSYITDEMTIGNIQYQVIRTILVIFGAAMSWTSAQTAIKHRFYRTILLEEIKKIESAIGIVPLNFSKGAQHPKHVNRPWEKLSSELMLITCLLFLALFFAALSGYNVYCYLDMANVF